MDLSSFIIVGFSRPKKFRFFSLLVRLWQGWTPYSHVYIKIHACSNVVYQASHGRVNCMLASNFYKENIVVKEFILEHKKKKEELQLELLDLLMKPYGFIGIIKIVLRKWAKSIFKLKGDGARSFHCSELVARLLPELSTKDPDFIEPKHIFIALETRTSSLF